MSVLSPHAVPQNRVVVLVGNPRLQSRTRRVAETLATTLTDRLDPSDTQVHTVELASLGSTLFHPESPTVRRAIDTVMNADLLVTATPVYKGSYTGLLKLFLDLLPAGALSGIDTVPVTLSASSAHREVADAALRWVLSELHACLPIISFNVTEADLPDLPRLARLWVREYGESLGLGAAVAKVVPALK